jgi:hypothetical protein
MGIEKGRELVERIPPPHEITVRKNARLLELVGESWGFGGQDICQAESADEVFLQIVMWLATGMKGKIYHTLLQYAKMEILTKDQLTLLIVLLIKSGWDWDKGIEMMPRLRNAADVPYFNLRETVALIEKAGTDLTPRRMDDFCNMYRMHEKQGHGEGVSIELLREWVQKCFNSFARDRDKYTSMLAIRLYNMGDKEVITCKNVVECFERHASAAPESHGNFRLLSLLGTGARERSWKIMHYHKQIAGALFHIFSDEVRRMDYPDAPKHPPLTFGIFIEILAEFKNQKAVRAILGELDRKIGNWERNIRVSYRLSRKQYMRRHPK